MFKNLWNEKDKNSYVKKINNSLFKYDLGTRVYSSRIIGKIPDLVMHGGGNTSCKTIQKDIFGNKINVLCIKGSGWDLDTIEAPGLPAVRLDPLLKLRNLNSLSDEDGIASINISWEKSKDGRNWIALNSVSGPSLNLNQDLVGFQIRTRVAVVDNFGIETNLYSLATRTVENVNNKPSGRIIIRRVGQ